MKQTSNSQVSADQDLHPVELINQTGLSPVLLVCEHASNFIPAIYRGLGLSRQMQHSHIAWDPGARAVAEAMSKRLDATLIASRISRLMYDCNRSPEMADAIPRRSEQYDIPGNQNLSSDDKKQRIETYYRPFHDRLTTLLTPKIRALVTIHSFAPVFANQVRDVEIGIIHDRDRRLADEMLSALGCGLQLQVRRNQPYAQEDGVTHTLRHHGVDNDLLNVMVEIKNDLLLSAPQQNRIATILAGALQQALQRLGIDIEQGHQHAKVL